MESQTRGTLNGVETIIDMHGGPGTCRNTGVGVFMVSICKGAKYFCPFHGETQELPSAGLCGRSPTGRNVGLSCFWTREDAQW